MDFADVVRRVRKENILFSVLVELTYRCNLDCFFCYNDTSLTGEPLSRDQYFRLFEELAELGVLHLTLSGGEPRPIRTSSGWVPRRESWVLWSG